MTSKWGGLDGKLKFLVEPVATKVLGNKTQRGGTIC